MEWMKFGDVVDKNVKLEAIGLPVLSHKREPGVRGVDKQMFFRLFSENA